MTLPDPTFWRGRRVLVTGHTGFKGGWLALWLARMGANVSGYALAPEYAGGVYSAATVGDQITPVTADIRDATLLRHCLALTRPQVVFHLAAQALVRRAHLHPIETWETNVVGTVKVLEEARRARSVQAVVVVTSDKVYENDNSGRSFVETDRLGGREPYGASKAAAEIAVAAFRESLADDRSLAIATTRAGNVIGGGDWADDRLIPDAMRAFVAGAPLIVRNPESTRPWQYVLDPLRGYLLLAERLMAGETTLRSPWNFGPAEERTSVRELADRLVGLWNDYGAPAHTPRASWRTDEDAGAPYEARSLQVDSTKAHHLLEWRPRFDLEQSLEATVGWYKAQQRGDDMAEASARAIDAYLG